MVRLLLLLSIVTACRADDRRAPASSPAPSPLPALASATQHDLARELAAAERDGAWSTVRRRWQGQRVRWDVTRHRALCGSADACNVAAFPVQRPAQQGWMPRLALAPATYAALEAACADADPCALTIEATLARLEASSELPTRVELTNVALVGPRPRVTATAYRSPTP
jgi:hypothetical protein